MGNEMSFGFIIALIIVGLISFVTGGAVQQKIRKPGPYTFDDLEG